MPGYGLAVAQAQSTLRGADFLAEKGIEVDYAIHQWLVACQGMNVLLASNMPRAVEGNGRD